jgi:hypothetical protein
VPAGRSARHGADLNVIDEPGCWILLHFLTAFPDTMPAIGVLLEFDANINVRDRFFGFTALTWAVMHRRFDLVQFSAPTAPPSSSRTTSPGRRLFFWPSTLKSRRLLQALADSSSVASKNSSSVPSRGSRTATASPSSPTRRLSCDIAQAGPAQERVGESDHSTIIGPCSPTRITAEFRQHDEQLAGLTRR